MDCEYLDYVNEEVENSNNEVERILSNVNNKPNIQKASIFVTPDMIETNKLCVVRNTNKLTFICLHYTAGYPNKIGHHVHDGVCKHHIEKGYRGAQYNYIIETDGSIWYVRDDRCSGAAHPKARDSIAICYQGGLRKGYGTHKGFDTRTEQQKASILALCKLLMKQYPTIKTIKGHRECNGASTECPGFDVTKNSVFKAINNNPRAFRKS